MLAKFAHGTTSIRTFEILPPGHRKTEKRIASGRDRPSNIQHQRMSVSALPATNIIKGLAQSSLVWGLSLGAPGMGIDLEVEVLVAAGKAANLTRN
jgi:hypothetical protein